MSKRIKPILGKPAQRFVEELDSELTTKEYEAYKRVTNESASDYHNMQTILSQLSFCINGDICLTKPQQDLIKYSIDQEETNLAKGTCIDPIVRDLAVTCNSFRLECEDCLNADCEMRDPEVPVPEMPKVENDQ